jgi:pyridinium-3,5-bisthiocarboxylic acid mononucleotide nickel chelatase
VTTVAYFDTPSGISGDMSLGALIDAGLSLDVLAQGLREALPELIGYRLATEPAMQHGIGGTRLWVVLDADDLQPQRDWRTIRAMLEGSGLPEAAKANALAIFGALAAAEGKIHGVPVEEVHFHEVGAVDSIVDIAGVALGLHLLGVERVYCSPLRDGRGTTRSQHGIIPIPAPATLALLAAANAPLLEAPTDRELVTPTGAAIVAALAEFRQPPLRLRAVGYGFGKRELPWPNALRVWLGEVEGTGEQGNRETGEGEAERDSVVLLETNIDDMNPQFYAPLIDRLLGAGALDAWLTPIIMKKGRPAITVSALAAPERADALAALLIEQTTTLGVRTTPFERIKAGRSFATVETPWGQARVKVKHWRGRAVAAVPEYDDCAALAASSGLPIATVHAAVARLAQGLVG